MLVKSASGAPITGRRRGQLYTAPGALNIARGIVAPIQPRTNDQVPRAIAVAAAAQEWKLIDPATRATWLGLFGSTDSDYNNFVTVNSNAIQWGNGALIESPYAAPIQRPDFVSLYAEPDGIHTTLVTVLSGAPSAVPASYIRLYLNFNKVGGNGLNSIKKSTYFGTFGPVDAAVEMFFDVTDLWTKNAGQWWYPASIDTTAQVFCGNRLAGFYWCTDSFGMPNGKPNYSVTSADVFGVEPVRVLPGLCPVSGSPPYPWPASH